MAVQQEIIACECRARDEFQSSMPVLVPTDRKVEMINRIVAAGFRKVERYDQMELIV